MIWTISKDGAGASHKQGRCHPPNSQVKKSCRGVHSPIKDSRSNTIVANTPNAPARRIKRMLPKTRAPRPLDFLLLANLTILPTRKVMTPIAMSNAPKGDGKTPTPNNSVIKAVNVNGSRSSESEGVSALEWTEGGGSIP